MSDQVKFKFIIIMKDSQLVSVSITRRSCVMKSLKSKHVWSSRPSDSFEMRAVQVFSVVALPCRQQAGGNNGSGVMSYDYPGVISYDYL